MAGESELKNQMVQGFGALIIREVLLKFLSFLGQIFLARILFPQDFGTYVIVVFVVGIFTLLSDVGLSFAIIRKKKEPTQKELSSIFWLKLFIAICLITIIFIISPYIPIFYPSLNESVIGMIQVFSLTILFSSLRTIPVAKLERKIKYNAISMTDAIGIFVYYATAIVLAFSHFGVWSLIVGTLIKELIETIVIYKISPFFPSFSLKMKSIKQFVQFGIFIQGNHLVTFSITSITPVIAGKINGSYAVGLLDFAESLASLPGIIAMNFGRVAFAGYARIQDNRLLLFRLVNKSISMLAIILYIFPVFLYGLGDEVIKTFYTEKWTAALPALYWFGAASFFQPFMAAIGQGILVIGKSKEIFRATTIAAIVGWVISVLLVTRIGFIGVAIAYFVISLLLFIFYIFIFRKAGYAFSWMLIGNKLIIFILSLLSCFFINTIIGEGIVFLFVKVILITGIYFFFAFIFARSDMNKLVILIKALGNKNTV